jgi:hypothetical protein
LIALPGNPSIYGYSQQCNRSLKKGGYFDTQKKAPPPIDDDQLPRASTLFSKFANGIIFLKKKNLVLVFSL